VTHNVALTDPPPCGPFTNGTDLTIPHMTTVDSQVAVAGCAGMARADSTVEVHIVHPNIGDLTVSLVAANGATHTLHNRTGGSADNIDQTWTLDLSTQSRNGTWKLRIRDDARPSLSGFLNSWTMRL
jgi:subtilisin-like proprotein convertase family protein